MIRQSGWRLFAAFVLVFAGLTVRGNAWRVPETSAQTAGTADIAPNRFIVRLKPGSTASSQVAATTYDNLSGVRIDQVYDALLPGFAGEFTASAVNRLINDPNVLDVRPDRKTWLAAQELPPGVERIDTTLNLTRAGNGSGEVDADIAVLDTGIYQHPDLNVVGGKDCANTARSGPYNDISGHGTHVAGTAAAIDNGIGVVGVAPGARLWAVKIFSDDQGGAAYESEVMCGLNWVRQNAGTIDVVNMSIGANYGYDLGPCWADAYHQAYCNTVAAGVPIVVAAQNWTINARVVVPAQFDEVITVSAYYDSDGSRGGRGPISDCTPRGGSKGVQKDDTFACFSNFGVDIDISAPGMDVISTFSARAEPDPDYCVSSMYCFMSGTSMATPHVAGAVALISAQQGKMSPSGYKARLLLAGERGPVPLDNDGYDEPMLNVAQLGKGIVSLPKHVKVGDRFSIEATGFTPGERAIFRLGGEYLGGITVGEDGSASRSVTMPAATAGDHPVNVSTGQRSISKQIDVNPSIAISPTSGPVGEAVDVRLRGFGSSESVLITFETGAGTRNLVRVTTTKSTGSANTVVTIPASTDGKHRVTATGNAGNATYTSYATQSSAYVSSGTPYPGALIRVQMLGFGSVEGVTARYDTLDGPVLGSKTLSATGSGSISVRIPESSTTGNHYVWIIGDQGNRVRVPLTVGPASVPTPEPTATATATAIATETEIAPTQASTETIPTSSPTERATVEPTATFTVEPPTETSTDVPPTEIPATEEATVVP